MIEDAFLTDCEHELSETFYKLDTIERTNARKVLEAFRRFRVSAVHMQPSTGYGLGDLGRDTLDNVFAHVFGAEAAITRPHFASGTHTLAVCLFALLEHGDEMISAAGAPYDTLHKVIGIGAYRAHGTLTDRGIAYKQVELANGHLDIPSILETVTPKTRLVLIQRSRGYAWRPSISLEQIGEAAERLHALRRDIIVMVDNCYGEFTQVNEPVEWGCDICAGSLIKNPGGGLAATGGYVAGSTGLVERCAERLFAPGIGAEYGSYAHGYRQLYQGLFMAPHTVNQALKVAALTALAFKKKGFEVDPEPFDERYDIVQAIKLGAPEHVTRFMGALQASSPIDSYVTPIADDMAGYADKIIMAGGTFIEGSTMELSADAPMRPPYIAYMQGGLHYAHGRIAIERMLAEMSVG